MKTSLKVLTLGLLFMATLFSTQNLHAQKGELAEVIKAENTYLLSGLKMSDADQKQFIAMIKANPKAFKVSFSSKRGNKSYGSLAGSRLKVKNVLESAGVDAATATCHTVSTDVNCVTVNSVMDLKALNRETRGQLDALMKKYMR